MAKYNLRQRNIENFPINIPEEIKIEPQYPFELSIKEMSDDEENVYDNQVVYNDYSTLTHIKQQIKNEKLRVFGSQSDNIVKSTYHCQLCDKEFKYYASLIRHRNKHREDRKMYACELCDKKYSRKDALVLHNTVHHSEVSPLKCDICDKTFVLKRYLHYHKKTHFSDRPYECDICNKKFLYRWHLIRHNLQHTGEKPYKCNVCNKTFTRSTGVSKHKKNSPCQN